MNKWLKKKTNIFFLIIIFFAFILRFYQLGTNPPSLDWDEASIGYNAYSILKTGADEYGNKFPISFRSFDDFKPPVYIYLTVPSVLIFGLNEFAVRLPAAAIGIIMVIVTYFFTLEVLPGLQNKTKTYIALASAFFLAISPWHLQFSRAAFEGNIGICFLIFSLLFFFKGLKNNKFLPLFTLFFLLSIYSYHSFRLINPILLLTISILFFKQLYNKKLVFLANLFFIIILSLPIYLNISGFQGSGSRLSMVTVFSDPSLQKLSAEKTLLAKNNHDIINQILYNRRLIFIPSIIKGYFDHFNFDFLFLHGDGGLQHHAYNMGMAYLWDFPFIIIGIVFLLKNKNKHTLVLLILFILAPLPSALTTGTPHPVRAIAMIPALQIFTAAGFITTIIYLIKRGVVGKISICAVVLLLLLNFTYYLYTYYYLTPSRYGFFWQYGNKEVIKYTKEHEDQYDKIIITFAYDQPYIYYLFYNKIDPSWYQKNWDYNKNGTIDRFYHKINKYEFMNITTKQLSLKNTLLIGTPSEIPNKIGQVKKEIKFPDGRVAYRIVSL